ncbi:MAG: hypothetical protein ACYC1W_12525, partial [Gemmatimonadaceae bacterium]
GAPPPPGAPAARNDGASVDFFGMASAAGFRSLHRWSNAAEWARHVPHVLEGPGPTFVLLDVAQVPGAVGPRSPGPAPARARELRRNLSREAG